MGRRDRALVLALVVGAWAGSGCAAKAPPELAHPPAAPSPPVVDVAPPPRVDVPPPLAPPAPLEVKVLQRGEARVATGPAHGRWGVVVELTWPRRSVLTMTLDSASVVARTQTGERLPARTMFFINPDPKVVAASPIGSNILFGSAITVGSETYEHAEGEIENAADLTKGGVRLRLQSQAVVKIGFLFPDASGVNERECLGNCGAHS